MGESVESYFDPKEPGSFAGATTFRRHHRNSNVNDLVNVLSGYRSYTLHKPVQRRFPRNRIVVGGIDSLWEVDLTDLSKYATENNGIHFLLCVIDVFSKKAWVLPLKNKSAPVIAKALETLFELTTRRPQKIRSDKGSEFKNRLVLSFLKKHKIGFYTSQNDDTKCAIVERFQRTFKGKMWRYFTHHRTTRYIDVLNDFVESYNNTYHRSIGMTPNQVTKATEVNVWNKMYGGVQLTNRNYKFQVGDHVRILSSRMIFRKAYEGEWTEELFKITHRIPRNPPVYRIADLNGESIVGTFYGKELQKIRMDDNVFIVEKVIRQRRRNGKVQYFVKWLGYQNSFNSWVDELI